MSLWRLIMSVSFPVRSVLTESQQDDALEFMLCLNCSLLLLLDRYTNRRYLADCAEAKEMQSLGQMVCYKLYHNISDSTEIGE